MMVCHSSLRNTKDVATKASPISSKLILGELFEVLQKKKNIYL